MASRAAWFPGERASAALHRSYRAGNAIAARRAHIAVVERCQLVMRRPPARRTRDWHRGALGAGMALGAREGFRGGLLGAVEAGRAKTTASYETLELYV
jgi:hypothetical protein